MRRSNQLFYFLAVVAVGLLQVWAHRNDMSPDGISYIEIAHSAMSSGLHGLTNAYWSPLYPLLISLTFHLLHPTIGCEFTAVHALNFFIYLASFATFRLFVKELCSIPSPATPAPYDESRFTSILATVLFLWAAQFWLSPAIVNPDMCVAALVYLATACLLRASRKPTGPLTWILFGGILGLAYLAKAAMFPLGFVFLGCAFLLTWPKRNATAAIAGTAAALIIFLAIAAPWVVAISRDKARWTFGDSGRIAYAEYINHATLSTHWQGQPPGTGTPLHPTREILRDPPMYEFAQPIPGSYPPWRDPSYWYDGIHPHFAIRGQLWVLFRALNMYFKMFSKSGALYVVFAALFWLVKRGAPWRPVSPEMWLAMLPCIAALAMYAFVLVELRYVSPFVLMLLVWTISRVQLAPLAHPAEPQLPRPPQVLRCVQLLALLAPIAAASWLVARDARDAIRNQPYEDWQVAQALPALGIPPGAQVGYIGSGGDAYWAYLAGDRIIAELPGRDQKRFISATFDAKIAILRKFAALGAGAVITKNAAVTQSIPGWHRVAQTQYFFWRP